MKRRDNRRIYWQQIRSFMPGVVVLITALVLILVPPASWAWEAPDPCSGGCTCLGSCGPQWPEGGGDVDLRWLKMQNQTPVYDFPKPQAESAWLKALRKELERDRNGLKRNIKNEIIHTRLADLPTVTVDYWQPDIPEGTTFFGLGEREPDMKVNLKSPSPVITKGTRIGTDSLRRTVAILGSLMDWEEGSLKKGMTDMDLYFLAEQAARAMNGHDLLVKVSDTVLPTINTDKEVRLRNARKQLDQAWNALAAVMTQRKRLEGQLFALYQPARKAGETVSAFREKNKKLLARYAKTVNGEAETRSRLIDAQTLFKNEVKVVLYAP